MSHSCQFHNVLSHYKNCLPEDNHTKQMQSQSCSVSLEDSLDFVTQQRRRACGELEVAAQVPEHHQTRGRCKGTY